MLTAMASVCRNVAAWSREPHVELSSRSGCCFAEKLVTAQGSTKAHERLHYKFTRFVW